MVVINCAAIPMTLAESYLFGHVKEAFTDASIDHKGIFESADGSALFLDEIAELTLEVQGKLLRVLQDGDRKSTRLNSSHQIISYAVFCLKKKKYQQVDSQEARHHIQLLAPAAQSG